MSCFEYVLVAADEWLENYFSDVSFLMTMQFDGNNNRWIVES